MLVNYILHYFNCLQEMIIAYPSIFDILELVRLSHEGYVAS